ncbi:MAG: hexokinase [Verrucomicrobia bacterium]|nr:hexokinase [Verrucomicrobiota bacterium]
MGGAINKNVMTDELSAELLMEMRIDPNAFNPDEVIDLFIAEMEKGLAGHKSSLPMIPAYVGIEGSVPHNEPVIVIDAGGTNLRICLAEFDESSELQISHFTKIPMLGTQGELTAKEFYDELANLIAPIADKACSIGFCFSYPAEIQPDMDGRLLHWTKEVRVPELVGQCIAKGLSLSLTMRGLGQKQIVILNDTVACLLAGRAEGEKRGSKSFIGFIMGTGTNTAYVEQNANISKLDAPPRHASQIINVESGGFARCLRGPLDIKLDKQSENPGGHIFEKMLSGVYLGKLSLELLQVAARRGMFSEETAMALLELKELSWIEVNTFMYEPNDAAGSFACCTDDDRTLLHLLVEAIIDRAALLTAANISATAIKCGSGLVADQPICINIDGSTYYKTYQLSEKVQRHLSSILAPRGIHYTCVHVKDAPIVGAAIAGLTAF